VAEATVLRGLPYSWLSKNSVHTHKEYSTTALLQPAQRKILASIAIQASVTRNSGTEEVSKKP